MAVGAAPELLLPVVLPPLLRTPALAATGAVSAPLSPVLLPVLSAPTLALPTVELLLLPVELPALSTPTLFEAAPVPLPVLPVFEPAPLCTLTLLEATPPLLPPPVVVPAASNALTFVDVVLLPLFVVVAPGLLKALASVVAVGVLVLVGVLLTFVDAATPPLLPSPVVTVAEGSGLRLAFTPFAPPTLTVVGLVVPPGVAWAVPVGCSA